MTWRVPGMRGKRIAVGGGGYLRLLPLAMAEWGLAQHERAGWPGCVYLHPWEVDPEQPRQRLGGVRGFRHYVNLRRTLPKLERLLRRRRFVGLAAALEDCEKERAIVDVGALGFVGGGSGGR